MYIYIHTCTSHIHVALPLGPPPLLGLHCLQVVGGLKRWDEGIGRILDPLYKDCFGITLPRFIPPLKPFEVVDRRKLSKAVQQQRLLAKIRPQNPKL